MLSRARLTLLVVLAQFALVPWMARAAETPELRTLREAMARLDELDRSLAAKPADTRAQLAKGQVYIWLGARTAAYRTLNPLEDIAPKIPGLDEAFEKSGRMENATFEQLLESLEESAQALIAGDAQHAADTFRISELILPDIGKPDFGRWTLHVIRGERLAVKKRFDLARADFNRARGPDGTLTAEAHVSLGRVFRDEENYDAALAEFGTVTPEARDDFPIARYWIAQVHVMRFKKTKETADLKTALAIFEELRSANPDDEDVIAGRKAALALLPADEKSMLPLDPAEELARAVALEKDGKRAEALRELDLLLLRFPKLTEAYQARARLTADRERRAMDEAIVQQLQASRPVVSTPAMTDDPALSPLHAAVHRRPYSSTPYIARARAYLSKPNRPRIDAAVADARKATLLDPYDPQAHAALAESLVARAKDLGVMDMTGRAQLRAEAFVAADRAVWLAPDDFELLMWRGDLVAAHGENIGQRAAAAIRFYTRALRVEPTSIEARLYRARAELEAGRKGDAAADYQAILAVDRNHVVAKAELARLVSGESDQLELDAKPILKPKR